MVSLRRSSSALLALSLILAPSVAFAQHVTFDAPGLLIKKSGPSGPPPPRAQPGAWPRLDPGAVLCRTQDDLDRYAANLVARANGGDIQPADCQIIQQPTAIHIVSREGPGATQVQVDGTKDATGWTNVWLPARAPATP